MIGTLAEPDLGKSTTRVGPREEQVKKQILVRAAVGALFALGLIPIAVSSPAMADDSSFYEIPATLPATNGEVIRAEASKFYIDPIKLIEPDSEVQRFMYRSTGRNGTPNAVTGTMLTPNKAWKGRGERPLVSYAVGTQGHAVRDSIRAAQQLPGSGVSIDNPVAITGYSQGGGAAASAGELAPPYVPEINLKAVAAGAVPAALAAVAENLDGSLYFAFMGYAVTALTDSYGIDMDPILNDEGEAVMAELADQCRSSRLPPSGSSTRATRPKKDARSPIYSLKRRSRRSSPNS